MPQVGKATLGLERMHSSTDLQRILIRNASRQGAFQRDLNRAFVKVRLRTRFFKESVRTLRRDPTEFADVTALREPVVVANRRCPGSAPGNGIGAKEIAHDIDEDLVRVPAGPKGLCLKKCPESLPDLERHHPFGRCGDGRRRSHQRNHSRLEDDKGRDSTPEGATAGVPKRRPGERESGARICGRPLERGNEKVAGPPRERDDPAGFVDGRYSVGTRNDSV